MEECFNELINTSENTPNILKNFFKYIFIDMCLKFLINKENFE